MNEYLIEVNNVENIPKESYVIYNMSGGIYYCKRQHWNNFSRFFVRTNQENYHLTMDLCLATAHSLLFDIDINVDESADKMHALNYIENLITSIIKPLFLFKLKHFTLIVAMRRGGGIHFHLPEILLTYDDYYHLCKQLQPQFYFSMNGIECKLDILKNATLANSGKPHTEKYFPFKVYYFDEKYDCMFTMKKESYELANKSFKRLKFNSNSFFRNLLLLNNRDEMVHYVNELMMPVVTPYQPIYKLTFNTVINNDANAISDHEIVANFTYRQQETQYIHKGNELQINCGNSWMKSYNYFTYSAILIADLDTTNPAMDRWYRISQVTLPVENDIFKNINLALKQDNFTFASISNPLKLILTYKNGTYFLPVFYALVQHLGISSHLLVSHLRLLLNNNDLLDKIEKMESKLIDYISQDFSINTILFCGSNLVAKPKSMKDKIQSIIENMKELILCTSTFEQLISHIRRIQERYFPIVVIQPKNSCKKPQRYMWNLINECWQEVYTQSDVQNLINTIWTFFQSFVKSNDISTVADLMKIVNVNFIGSSIMSETNIERKKIEMDRHKWHIRIKEGIFDLLTGHIGSTVPEFYISDKYMDISIKELSNVLKRQDLIKTYQLLIDKSFFLHFLKALFTDMTDDLYDTLREIFCKHGGNLNDLTESMLQFYVHFCKYTSFEYDNMMYLLDVLSSLLIATNYARKFFVFKGNTRNGKSKFFQMISKVFGGYGHTIRSVNLQQSNCGLQAQPELASSIFNCRIVMVEEMSGKLNENVVKEITGNSTVSFRNLYEQNQGGIPSAKIFASTNSLPECIATEAFKDRVVAIPFEAVFTENAPKSTSEQLAKGEYLLETSDSLIEDSYQGFFLLIYLHLVHNISNEDGTIHYRKEPEGLIEYKEQFLVMTDIFSQFQQFMDVQIIPGCITTYQDIKSAIRQFLKKTRNTTVDEIDLLLRFDKEYKHLKHLETDLNSYCPIQDETYFDPLDQELAELEEDNISQITEDNDMDEPKCKRSKMEENIIIYRNIHIKNLRKEKR
ncbi:SF3 helicase domain-containing protein [Trichonephila inaurata madagascariensis]|uniref:SF3 helicase domain-containing protein n=1 Tax=Trichonephila inaurata madagascariensis TaxID=2747483 RepID=A0A8X6YA64_9ARAC|nr:SF3 helicase domain-containing protein [Trichonephila inaurata madagascariensis]